MNRLSIATFLIACSGLAALSTLPGTCDAGCPELVNRWPWPYGPTTSVAVSGSHVYYGVDEILVVARNVEPGLMLMRSATELSGHVTDITVANDTAWVSTYPDGLRIIDVSSPWLPVEVGSILPQYGSVSAVAVDGSHAYAAADMDGLLVFDVSVPSAPALVGSIDRSIIGRPTDVAVSGDMAYVVSVAWLGSHRGLHVIDVHSPSSPTLTGQLATPSSPEDVAVAGRYVFLREGSVAGSSTIRAIDVGSPNAPLEVASCTVPGDVGSLTVDGDQLLVTSGQRLTVLSATNPSGWSPEPPGALDLPGTLTDLAASDGLAFAAAADGGLRTIDISVPAAPFEIGTIETSGSVAVATVAASRTYVADCRYHDLANRKPQPPCRFRVIDVSPAGDPTELGSVELPDRPEDIVVSGCHAFLASNVGFRVIDVSVPSNLTEVGGLSWEETTTHTLVVADGYGYVATERGLLIIDLSVPSMPTIAATVPGGSLDIALSDGHAYVAEPADSGGLKVLDVSDATSPFEVGFVDTPGPAVAVGVFDDLACLIVADDVLTGPSDPRMWIMDVSEPASPVVVGVYWEASSVYQSYFDLAVANGHALISMDRIRPSLADVMSSHTGLLVVDITDPTAPVEVGFRESEGDAGRIAESGGLVYQVDGWAGVEIIDVSGCQGFIPPRPAVRASGGRVAP